MCLLLLGVLCRAPSAGAGPYAGGSVDIKLDFSLVLGPTISGGLFIGEDGAQGVAAAGFAGSILSGWPKLSLAAALDGGVRFPELQGFVHLNIGAGSSFVTLGPSLVVVFDEEHAGFAVGPEATAHWNLGRKRGGHELQLAVRGDFFAVGHGHFGHAAVVMMKFVLMILK